MTRWRRLALWGPVVLWMALIFYLSALSQPPEPPVFTLTQAHAIGYMALAVLVARALAGGLPARIGWATAFATVAVCVAYGASDEFHQSFVPGRSVDASDVVADAVGAAIGTAACWAWGIIARTSD